MPLTPESSVDERLRLLAEELAAQRAGDGAADVDERMAYLEEAMAASRLSLRLTTRRAGGTTG